MPLLECRHCGTTNDTEQPDAACRQCGRPLAAGPVEKEHESSPVMKPDELTPGQQNAARNIAVVFFGAALLQLMCGFGGLVSRDDDSDVLSLPAAEVLGKALVYLLGRAGVLIGIGVWALYRPIVAGTFGLLFFITLSVVEFIVQTSAGGDWAIDLLFKVCVVLALFRMLSASLRVK
jgi:hypothetical protein